MKKLRTLIPVLLLIAAFTGVSVFAQGSTDALVRFAHAIPGAGAVDIYVDGQLTIANLDFGQASNYLTAPAIDHQITVTPTGATTALWEQAFTPGAGRAFTLVASSFDEPVAFTSFEDILEPLPLGKSRFTTIHAIADGPAVDIVLDDGRPLVLQQSYDQPYGTLDVPVFTYNLAVVPSGEGVDNALLSLENTALNTGTSSMLLIYGTAANPQATLLSAATRPETENSGFVRLAHGIPGAPAVDVFVNDGIQAATLFAPGEGTNTTGYLALPAGDYEFELRASGTQDVLASASATVAGADYATAIALANGDDVSLNVLSDGIGGLTPDQALVRVINAGAVGTAVSASLTDGTIIANDLAVGSVSSIATTGPATGSIVLSAGGTANTLPEQTFYGGVFYDVLALSEASPIVSEAAIAQGIGSGPGATIPVVVAVEPTAVPPVEAPAAPTAVPQPTIAPAVQPDVAGITGRVFNLNPDANLQLRQYPDSNSSSLGTIPFGTILAMNGREGALEEIFISATQMPPDYEYVDPVSLLVDDRDDLDPQATWLNVTYNTPDGGTIEAWVRADFIDVRDELGERLPLRDLETIPGNRPGEAQNTDITPPPIPEDIVNVEVINIDPTANLNVRRTPDTQAEVLAQLSLGTIAQFVGIGPDESWVFLSHTSPDGTTTTGWASTDFLNFSYRGRAIDLAELDERGLLAGADESQRGNQTVGAAPVIAPTVDPTIDAIVAEVALDPGANLNLRRNPDVIAEVLAQVPSGTQLIVSERTADAQWLRVTYEGVDGWVAAQTDTAVFVVVTFNGNSFAIEDVPVAETAG